jgi:uncharacterized protein (DUF1501 family)
MSEREHSYARDSSLVRSSVGWLERCWHSCSPPRAVGSFGGISASAPRSSTPERAATLRSWAAKAEQTLNEARQRADEIVQSAQRQAEALIEGAERAIQEAKSSDGCGAGKHPNNSAARPAGSKGKR